MQIKNNTKNKILIALLAAVFAFATGGLIINSVYTAENAVAEAEQDYYYSQLTPEAKRFYDAIADMDEQGLLKQGNAKYDLIENEVLTKAQLDSYATSSSVMVAFGAARDAYYLDHPEVFYIDFSYLSVSVGLKGGDYVATLGTGRADNYFIADGFKSETEVNTAVTAYNAAVDAIVTKANESNTDADKVKSVNASLVEKVTYSFCTSSEESDYAPHIRNAYGALVNGKAVCEGFTRSFKCVMDKLGIPCVIVQGYASYEGGLEPHAWNAVKIDNSWYGVDVTWNDGTGKPESYLLRGDKAMSEEHIKDGVISAANFKFEYPLLNPNDYGTTASSAIKFEADDDGSGQVLFKLSMDGKNSTQLKDQGLWLAQRYYYKNGTTGSFEWTPWTSIYASIGYLDDENHSGYSITYMNASTMYIQFGVINYAPDVLATTYNPEKLSDADFVAITDYYENEGYGTYYGAPYIKETKPAHTSTNLDVTRTYDIEITYTQSLKKVDESKEIDILVSTINSDAKNYYTITDKKWNGTDTVSFKFTPSAMYQHRDEVYTFTPANLVGNDSGKEPMSVMYITENNNVACNKMYGDGRLYVNTYGAPSLVGSGDLSLKGWTDESGNPVSENQRSQLMLVATKTTEKEGGEMVDSLDLPDNSVKKAETFEINMNLCKSIVKIPNGSTVQVAFGFPAGYGPDDAGVTFKVYHFKRGTDGKIDYSKTVEVDCVITEYGLIVNVSDFSPFAIVAVDSSKIESNKKSVFARSVGFGGSFEGEIAQLVGEGESVTYKLKPDEGYRVAKVTLNGEEVTVNGDTVTLNYSQLANRSAIEVHYVADSVAEYEAANGITVIYPCVKIIPDFGGNNGNTGISPTLVAVIIVLVVFVIAAAAVTVAIVLVRKKNRA